MSDVALRPRSVTEILDATIQLFRNYFTTILAVGAVAMVPWFVLQLLINAMTGYTGGFTPGVIPTPQAAFGQLLSALGMWLGFALMSGAVIRVSADAYLGTEPNIGRALSATLHRLGSLILAGFYKGILVFLPVFAVGIVAAVVIPMAAAGGGSSSAGVIGVVAILLVLGALALMLYLLARYVTVEAAVVLEDRGASSALGRSAELTRGRVWPIAGTLVIAFVIYVALLIGVTTFAALTRSSFVTLFATDIFIVLVYPLYAILTMLLYYDGRVRNEALDLEMMAQSLGAAPGPMTGAPTPGTSTAP